MVTIVTSDPLGDAQAIGPAMEATRSVPLVMTGAIDPVGAGYIQTLGRPGGNVTGVSSLRLGLGGKRLELLKEAGPGIRRIAVLFQGRMPIPIHEVEWREMETAAAALGLEIQPWEMVRGQDPEGLFHAAMLDPPDALVVLATPLIVRHADRIMEMASHLRIPVVGPTNEWGSRGALFSLGPDLPVQYHRAAVYVDKILKGANPAELPVEQPMEFILALNTEAAATLGITVPDSILARVTRVIP